MHRDRGRGCLSQLEEGAFLVILGGEGETLSQNKYRVKRKIYAI